MNHLHLMTLPAKKRKTKRKNKLSLLLEIKDQEPHLTLALLRLRLPINNPKKMKNKRPLLARRLYQVMIQMTHLLKKILKRKARLFHQQKQQQ